eukprot:TRINITY_DN624_c0_g1_i2.p1 TRINITY_DN624_c0_g1~~TRINITY_DN624_c0_g1_i2.p1  ORF type:complete len:249 (-),score=55.71 TRINITY_DN624_c0_g1_i2:218-964(-)
MIAIIFGLIIAFILFKFTSKGKKGSMIQFNTFKPIPDQFKTLEQVQKALRDAGLESSNLIMGIDYTGSNDWTGTVSFGGRSLHHIDPYVLNPYQQVIRIVGETLAPFDDDNLIPCYGFGDISTQDRGVFDFYENGQPCHGFEEAMFRYNQITPHIQKSGPTSFAPLIKKAIEIVKEEKSYHILIIIADGQVTEEKPTIDAIVEASQYPLSIVVIGVGDGPWDQMENFDDGLPARKFDNVFYLINNLTL